MQRKNTQTPCERVGARPDPPARASKVGIALSSLGQQPINGLRHAPHGGVCGWYFWCGEEPLQEANFFSPLHVSHLGEYLPVVQGYLDLPPGWRFLIDGEGYEDSWFDASLIDGDRSRKLWRSR